MFIHKLSTLPPSDLYRILHEKERDVALKVTVNVIKQPACGGWGSRRLGRVWPALMRPEKPEPTFPQC